VFSLFFGVMWAICCLTPPPAAPADACTCPEAKTKNGWCGLCRIGYVAGLPIKSAMLFEAMDAHGHDIDPERILCPSCRKALETDGFCDICRMGFLEKKAYLSRLTYHVAKGAQTDPARLSCPVCRKNTESQGWCGTCKRGMIGHVAVSDPKDFDQAAKEFERLFAALKMLDRCETCAVAFFTKGTCLTCNVSYKPGRRTKPQSQPNSQEP